MITSEFIYQLECLGRENHHFPEPDETLKHVNNLLLLAANTISTELEERYKHRLFPLGFMIGQIIVEMSCILFKKYIK